MRLGLVLEASAGEPVLASLARQASACERAGIDLAWLGPTPNGFAGATETFATVASLAPVTSVLRLVACVRAGSHPLRIAEEAVVADNCANGRLVLVLSDPQGGTELLGESADVLLAATAPRPFSHHGARWKIPAGRPENEIVERRLRVMPAPAQIELPIWLVGPAAAPVARARGVSHVCTSEQPAGAAAADWAATEAHLGLAAARLRRPAIRVLDVDHDGGLDSDAFVAALRDEREQWGLDVAVIRLPGSLGDRARVHTIDDIGRLVRPRVQLDALPAGLEAHWQQTIANTDEKELGA